MTLAWAAGALVMFLASFVMGLTGFGIALVAMAFLPWLMSPVTAIVVLTIYALVFSLAVIVQLRRDLTLRPLVDLLIGTVAGTPLGVWVLATLPVSALNRLIGLVLVIVVVLELRGVMPRRLVGRAWGLATGFLAGLLGGAVGTPGPPVIVYATTQGWSPRTMKANTMGFFVVNQGAILIAYWWAGLLTHESRDGGGSVRSASPGRRRRRRRPLRPPRPVRFRRIIFGLLLISGLILLVRG